MSEETKQKLNAILDKIKSGNITKTPRWHFVLRHILLALAVAIVTVIILFVASFMLFALRQSGVLFAPLFGFRGVGFFVLSLPWLLVLLVGAFLVVLEVLVRKYSVAYRKPALYSLLALLIVAGVGTYVISSFSVHERIYGAFASDPNGPFGIIYHRYDRDDMGHVHTGIVTVFDKAQELSIRNKDDEDLTVLIDEMTRMPQEAIAVGDAVIVIGDQNDDTIHALGILKEADDTLRTLWAPHNMMMRPMQQSGTIFVK